MNIEWGEHRIGDLFEIKIAESIDKNKIAFCESGAYDFVGRSSINNGIQGKINKLNFAPNPKNTFSLSQIGCSTCLFRENEWYASQNIFILIPKDINSIICQNFITTSINKSLYKYQQAYIYPTLSEIKEIKINLPSKNDKIDFKFMKSFVAELEAQRVAELEAYLIATGLDNYELNEDEKIALTELSNLDWQEKNIIEFFDIKNTRSILSCEVIPDSGKTPYLCASKSNNSVSNYISYNNELLDKGNCIFIGGKTFTVSYQEIDFFSNDSHNLALYLKDKNEANKMNQLYLSTCIKKSLTHKYSWGNSISNKKIQKDKIMVPLKNGKINYIAMTNLISAIQKLVIKDVVDYANIKIRETKKIIKNK